MKKMLLGIFLLVLSVWCFIFGKLDDLTGALVLAVALPGPAVMFTVWGYFSKDD